MTLIEAKILAQEKYPIENPNCATEVFFKTKMREEYVEKLLNQNTCQQSSTQQKN